MANPNQQSDNDRGGDKSGQSGGQSGSKPGGPSPSKPGEVGPGGGTSRPQQGGQTITR